MYALTDRPTRQESTGNSHNNSMLDFLLPQFPTSRRDVFRAAQACNKLAKIAIGQVRRKLYRMKDDALRKVITTGGHSVRVEADHERYPGLLSVSLVQNPTLRLHTHEAWL